jgi:hypothetical protein
MVGGMQGQVNESRGVGGILRGRKEGNLFPSARSTTKTVLLLFSLFTASDFVLGYIHERTIPAGVISVVGGLLSTAYYLLMWKWASKDDGGSDLFRQ